MAAQKEDRRIRRTKRLLRQALAEIMNEKEFKDITVKEITDRADLNRGTFYFHYTDTYDLREKIEDELVHDFEELISSYQPTQENYSAKSVVEQAVSFVEEQKFLVRTLFQRSSDSGLQAKFTKVIEDAVIRIRAQMRINENAQNRPYHCRFISYGIIGCMNLWLQGVDGMTGEGLVDELDEMINCFLKE
ncbi:MAG: TetR/AcrR family transcriptional regulator [Clostridia bacterium]|nr:TetR/AcrR family transcriptional regulator [Clostridia bacterium]